MDGFILALLIFQIGVCGKRIQDRLDRIADALEEQLRFDKMHL